MLDVRSAEDYASVNIPGALNIPVENLQKRMKELSPRQETPIAIICTTDRRSRKAARILERGD